MTRHVGTLRALNATVFRLSALHHLLLASVVANDFDNTLPRGAA